jgi:hypothetical protein
VKNNKHCFDAILIPGGGLRGSGDVPPWVKRRLDRAVEIRQDEYIITLSAGTTHKPQPRDKDGFTLFESEAAARYLMVKGVPQQYVLCETSSYDTIGNAYFSRVIHAEPRGFKKLLVINSDFHMPRTKAIFQWVYGLPANNSGPGFELYFEAVPDDNEGLDETTLLARSEKEKKGMEQVIKLKEKIRTLPALHQWLFAEHGAYAAGVKPVRLTGDILSIY